MTEHIAHCSVVMVPLMSSASSSGTRLHRGYVEEAAPEDTPPETTHIVFVVHGIGQKMDQGRIIRNTSMWDMHAQRFEKAIRIILKVIVCLAGVQDERCCQEDGGEALLWSHHRARRVPSCGVEVETGSGWRYASWLVSLFILSETLFVSVATVGQKQPQGKTLQLKTDTLQHSAPAQQQQQSRIRYSKMQVTHTSYHPDFYKQSYMEGMKHLWAHVPPSWYRVPPSWWDNSYYDRESMIHHWPHPSG